MARSGVYASRVTRYQTYACASLAGPRFPCYQDRVERMTLAGGELDAEAQLRLNIRELMEVRHLTQAKLADRLGKDQPWVSRRLTGAYRFQIEDLDEFSRVFGLSPAELLRPGVGKWDRRRATANRRSGYDRRRSASMLPEQVSRAN